MWFLLFYFNINNSIKSIQEGIDDKFNLIEYSIYSEITNANHIMHVLAVSLSKEIITPDNKDVTQTVYNFDYGLKKDKIDPLVGFVILNKDGLMVANSEIPEYQTKLITHTHSICFNSTAEDFFELRVNPIRIGIYLNEVIIPLNIKFSNIKHHHIGTICSGLKVGSLNEKLKSQHAKTKYFNDIRLKNPIEYDQEKEGKTLTIRKILKNYFSNDSLTAHKLMSEYPILIEIKVKPEYFKGILSNLQFFILLSIIFVIFSCLSWSFAKNILQDHLFITQKKLNALNQWINTKSINKVITSDALLLDKFHPIKFAQDISELIDRYYILQKELNHLPELEIKKKILNLILTEKHFLSKNTTNEDKLYINKLMTIIDEESVNMFLVDFLNKVASYCSEFYHELNIKIVVQKKDQKQFTFKHAALIETIFHIFTFMNRGSFDTDNVLFTLKGSFADGNKFPSISIETTISDGSTEPLGWSFGPDYTHISLLSIYLLAKENKLFFDIVKKGNKIIFILDPIDKKIDYYNDAFIQKNLFLNNPLLDLYASF